LQTIGLNPEFSERNDLFLSRKKISGNAEHIYKNRVLHHGTLLVDSNKQKLYEVLNNNKLIVDKSINSVKKEVANISDFIQITSQDVFLGLQMFLQKYYNAEELPLSIEDKEEINRITGTKYKTYSYIFAYSPSFVQKISFKNEELFVYVKNGIIEKILCKNVTIEKELSRICGTDFLPESINKILTTINIDKAGSLTESFFVNL